MNMPRSCGRCLDRRPICATASPRSIATVEKMSECMFEFEDLLELQRTQIQMLVGEIDRRQIEVLSQRITIAVLFPRLKKRLA